jgi:peptidoglycan/LPS O-acetylase OafA/YrhL
VEEQYYLIWPLLLLLVPRRWIVPLLLGLIAVNVAAAMGAFGSLRAGPLLLGLHIPTYAPILMGSLVGLLLHGRGGFQAMYRLSGFAHAPLVWLGALVLAAAVLPRDLGGAQNLLLHVLMCLWLAALVVREDHPMAPALTWAPVARIGQISYGVYLYHLFALAVAYQVVEALGLSETVWILPLMAGISIAMAELSFRTYEAWFMRLRDTGLGQAKPRAAPTSVSARRGYTSQLATLSTRSG